MKRFLYLLLGCIRLAWLAVRWPFVRFYESSFAPVPSGMVCTECGKDTATERLDRKQCVCGRCFTDITAW